MRHGLTKKKMACPRRMTKKKGHMKVPVLKKNWTHEGPRKKRDMYINIAMSSCYPNKGERDS